MVDGLGTGESTEIALGDTEFLKSVTQELKTRGMTFHFESNGGYGFVVLITK
ncbi:MAG: hypothetical protein ACE5H4_07495 [Candidatus Thorarchaeota archaeon]